MLSVKLYYTLMSKKIMKVQWVNDKFCNTHKCSGLELHWLIFKIFSHSVDLVFDI